MGHISDAESLLGKYPRTRLCKAFPHNACNGACGKMFRDLLQEALFFANFAGENKIKRKSVSIELVQENR